MEQTDWSDVQTTRTDANRKGNSMISGFGIRGTRHNEGFVEDFFNWCEENNGRPVLDHDDTVCEFSDTKLKLNKSRFEIEDQRAGSMDIRGLSGYTVYGDTFAVHDGYEKVEIRRI